MISAETNMLNGIQAAIGHIPDFIILVISQYICPILVVCCAAVLVFTIFRTGASVSQMKENIESNISKIAILIVCIIVLSTFSIWSSIALGR
ncbi:MAG: hypothetical protein RR508_08370 [Oscillospiraceae bacterium]